MKVKFAKSHPAHQERVYSATQLRKLDQLAIDAKKGKDMFGPFDSVDDMFHHIKKQK
ncbi:MAG: hypothetical protein KBD00_05395 [Candidatus Peribacteraceae bacterium]|nr:hypothetical protein [Candidatus Peribacteraceae bacterium]